MSLRKKNKSLSTRFREHVVKDETCSINSGFFFLSDINFICCIYIIRLKASVFLSGYKRRSEAGSFHGD